METAFITETETSIGTYWIVEGQDTGIEYAQCDTRKQAAAFCREAMIAGQISGFCVNE